MDSLRRENKSSRERASEREDPGVGGGGGAGGRMPDSEYNGSGSRERYTLQSSVQILQFELQTPARQQARAGTLRREGGAFHYVTLARRLSATVPHEFFKNKIFHQPPFLCVLVLS